MFLSAESVIKEITLFIFFELAKASSIWVLDLVDDMIWLSEVYLVLIPDDLALRLSLEGHLDDIPRFVIKETVGVSQPRNCSEKDNWFLGWVAWHNLVLRDLLALSLLAWSISVIGVHVVGVFGR